MVFFTIEMSFILSSNGRNGEETNSFSNDLSESGSNLLVFTPLRPIPRQKIAAPCSPPSLRLTTGDRYDRPCDESLRTDGGRHPTQKSLVETMDAPETTFSDPKEPVLDSVGKTSVRLGCLGEDTVVPTHRKTRRTPPFHHKYPSYRGSKTETFVGAPVPVLCR